MSQSNPYLFKYTDDQASKIRGCLKQAGLQSSKNWPSYRARITSIMRTALVKASYPPLPYASPAGKQLGRLMTSLDKAVKVYDELTLELQYRIDGHLPGATLFDPLLMDSLLPKDRPVAERLLSSGRFPLALKAVREAAALAAGPLLHAGKPAVVSQELLAMLPPNLTKIVAKNALRARREDELFQTTGAPPNHAMRYAVQHLLIIYKEATGTPPKMYPSQYAPEGYAGTFYTLAAAALGPTHLVNPTVLGSSIHAAYKKFCSGPNKTSPGKK